MTRAAAGGDGGDAARDGDDAEYGGMRDMFRQMREATDEEPPAAGLEALLAAARAQTPGRAAVAAQSAVMARPGLLARASAWIGALARQPAFAGAAMLVVVASVGGVLYSRGGPKVAGQSAAPAVADRAAGAFDGATAGSGAASRADLRLETAVAGSAAPAARPDPAPAPPTVPPALAASTDPAASKKAAPAPIKDAPPTSTTSTTGTTVAGVGKTGDFVEIAQGDATVGPESTAGGGPMRSPSTTDKPAPSDDDAEEGRDIHREVADGATTPSSAAHNLAAVRAAAARGDCASARKLAQQVAAAELERLIESDADVRRCLQVR